MARAVLAIAWLLLVASCGESNRSPNTPTPGPPFSRTGSGNAVFDMPRGSLRMHIYGRWNGQGLSNFQVRIGGRLVVNAVLREQNPYEGIHLVAGGVVEVVSSDNIEEWRFTEQR